MLVLHSISDHVFQRFHFHFLTLKSVCDKHNKIWGKKKFLVVKILKMFSFCPTRLLLIKQNWCCAFRIDQSWFLCIKFTVSIQPVFCKIHSDIVSVCRLFDSNVNLYKSMYKLFFQCDIHSISCQLKWH